MRDRPPGRRSHPDGTFNLCYQKVTDVTEVLPTALKCRSLAHGRQHGAAPVAGVNRSSGSECGNVPTAVRWMTDCPAGLTAPGTSMPAPAGAGLRRNAGQACVPAYG